MCPYLLGHPVYTSEKRLKHDKLNTYWYIMRKNQDKFCEHEAFFEQSHPKNHLNDAIWPSLTPDFLEFLYPKKIYSF